VNVKSRALAFSWIALSFLFAAQALVLRRTILRDTRPPSWDQAVHLEIALDYKNAISAGDWKTLWTLKGKPGMPPFPPVYHLALIPAYQSSAPAQAALWVNWLYFVLLTVSIFGIAWYFRGDMTAVLAAAVFALSPGIQKLAQTQLIDISVVAMSAAAFWALLKSNRFSRWPGSVAVGLLFAAGMMHKWSFFSYMVPVYFVGLEALCDPNRRLKAWTALLIAVALSLPWYLIHFPVLLPKLVQAASDSAVSVFKGATFFEYLFDSATSLGPLLWIFGWLGLLAAHPRRNSEDWKLVVIWVLSSYLFWTFVPNRQMRFLLPGLPGLALAVVLAWPDFGYWAVAAGQIFLAANFSAGWISPLRVGLPMGAASVFLSEVPRAEDWKISAVLTEAEGRAGEGPIADLTLVANDTFFNGPTFTWQSKLLGLKKVHVRGATQRLCELSEFVVLKTGSLGPESVIGRLGQAAQEITTKNGWFQHGYSEVKRFPLPDHSEAVLYERRKGGRPPFFRKEAGFEEYDTPALEASDLKIHFGSWDISEGEYKTASVSAERLKIRGLQIEKVGLDLEGLSLVSAAEPGEPEFDDVRFLKLRRLTLRSARISDSDLKYFLEARVKGLKVESIELEKTIKLSVQLAHLSLYAEVLPELKSDPQALVVTLLDARIGTTRLPAFLLSPWRKIVIPFEPNSDTPFEIRLAGLGVSKGELTIP
jgi:hypothetical protein